MMNKKKYTKFPSCGSIGKSDYSETKASIFATTVTALLGEVSPSLRKVTLEQSENSIIVKAYFNGEISDEDKESMDFVETELFSHFLDTHNVKVEIIQFDAPLPLNNLPGIAVYQRRE